MSIRVYNRYLDLLFEIDRYQSLRFKRNFHGIGDFELHINRYINGADTLEKGHLIALNKQSNKVCIIQTKEIALDEGGKETENFKLTGYTLDGLMQRRITVPPSHTSHDRISGSAETVMKHYVYKNFVDTTKERQMPFLEIADSLGRGNHVKYESRYKTVSDELEKISINTGLGWGVFANFSTKKLIFDVIERKDLTQDNAQGNNPVFFSPEFETIKSQEFIDSDNDLRNVGFVGGQGEGVDRKIVKIGDVSGWDRIETFVDARDISDEDEETEEELTDEEVEELLIERGEKKMAEMETIFTLEAEILTPVTKKVYELTHQGYRHPGQPVQNFKVKNKALTPFEYEKDFDLGDYVDVVNKSWNLTMTAPITEITEIYESDGFKLDAVFGRNRPTLISKLNEKFNELEGIEKQEAPEKVSVSYSKENKKYTEQKSEEDREYTDEQDKVYDEKAQEFTEEKANEALNDAIAEAVRQDELVRQDAQEYANKAEENAKSESVAREEYNKRVEEIRNEFDDQDERIEKINVDLEEGIKVDVSTLRKDVNDNLSSIEDANAQLGVHSEAIEQRVKTTDFDEATERITDAESELKTISGEVSAKVSQKDFDNVEGRVEEAESELKLLPGEIDAKVEKDGVVGAINATPEELLIDFGRVKMEGALEARHIKSLNGLNVGDQFIVDSDGNVVFAGKLQAKEGYFGDNLRLVDGKLEIVRPDGAVSTSDGMTRASQAIQGFTPMFMEMDKQSAGYRGNAFNELNGYFFRRVGDLDGRTDGFDDVRNGDYRSSLRIQRYQFLHTARYIVLTYRSRVGVGSGYDGNAHRHLALIYDQDDNKLVDHGVPENTTATDELIVDLGTPDFKEKYIDFRIGWAAGWGGRKDYINFRINGIVLTDFID